MRKEKRRTFCSPFLQIIPKLEKYVVVSDKLCGVFELFYFEYLTALLVSIDVPKTGKPF